jgi:predicted  nucleic acid-binding Zn-ribbon protein
LDEVDRDLADWRQKLTAASNNVMELIDSLTYRRLMGQVGIAVDLQGTTRDQVLPALSALNELWHSFALVSDVLDRSNAVRKGINKLFPSQEKMQEIDQLLNGPSVKLPSIKTPLAQRGLLTPAEISQTVTPQRLLEAMVTAFDTAKQVLLAVDEAWLRLEPALGQAETEAKALQEKARDQGEAGLPELAAVEDKINALRTQVQADPLGSQGGFDRDIRPLLARVGGQLTAAVQERQSILHRMQSAAQTLAVLQALHDRCNQAWTRCQESIADPPPAPRKDPQVLANLATRIQAMQAHLADRSWTPAQISKGLETWQVQAAAFQEAEDKASTAYEALLAEREELKGLLKVYRSRAEKRGVSEDAMLAEMGRQAEYHLYTSPRTALAEARQFVNQFRERIVALSG